MISLNVVSDSFIAQSFNNLHPILWQALYLLTGVRQISLPCSNWKRTVKQQQQIVYFILMKKKVCSVKNGRGPLIVNTTFISFSIGGIMIVSHLWKTPALLFVIVLFLSPVVMANQFTLTNVQVHLCFTPGEDCADKIVNEINNAKSDIYIQAYSFTSTPIAKALVDAFKRGITVEVILDKSQRSERYTSASFIANARIPTYIDDKHAIAHNKVIIIDRTVTITGSFNFTKAAQERNAENLLIIRSREIAKSYYNNWLRHRKHSRVYEPRY